VDDSPSDDDDDDKLFEELEKDEFDLSGLREKRLEELKAQYVSFCSINRTYLTGGAPKDNPSTGHERKRAWATH
jgi:hypothetical protein